MNLRRVLTSAAILGATLPALAACSSEEQVVRYKPFLTGISGAQHSQAPVLSDRDRSLGRTRGPSGGEWGGTGRIGGPRPGVSEAQVRAEAEGRIVVIEPDGSKRLIIRRMAHVVRHLERLLAEEDYETLYEQLVSQATREHFEESGKDPKTEIIAHLRTNRREIITLASRMPLGENTPTVIADRVDSNRYKLNLDPRAGRDLNMRSIWVVLERGTWKLWWVS